MSFGVTRKNRRHYTSAEDQKADNRSNDDDKHSSRSQESQSEDQKPNSSSGNRKKLGKYNFRLSPEEQELAYELKASLMKKLDDQNAKINAELELHRKFRQMKKQERARTANPAEQTEMSRQNAIKLMKLYEKNSIKAEARVKELEKDFEIAQDLARRYHAMYLRERAINEKSYGGGGGNTARSRDRSPAAHHHNDDKKRSHSPDSIKSKDNDKGKSKTQTRPGSSESSIKSNQGDSSPQDKKKNDQVTEEDLEDDQALYKRHVARLVDLKSVVTTSPIRVTDVIRKSEVTHIQNETLKREIQRLKWDNAQLIKQSKHSKEDRDKVMHNLGTSEFARQDLQKRLEREKTQHQKLQRSLTRQASEWIQQQKESQEAEERRRWGNVGAIAPYDADGRSRYATKKNVDKPRKMHPVEEWDKSEEKT